MNDSSQMQAYGLGRLFGRMYARWCTERMVRDAARHFAQFKEKR